MLTVRNFLYSIQIVALEAIHTYKLFKQRFHLDVSKYFLSNRVIDLWNSLPDHIVTAPSINYFKIMKWI